MRTAVAGQLLQLATIHPSSVFLEEEEEEPASKQASSMNSVANQHFMPVTTCRTRDL